jgi:hypothetical protein
MNAERFKHSTHRATGDDTGTGWCCTQNNFTCAMATSNVVMQCAAFAQWNANERTLCGLSCLTDCFRNFAGLTVTEANATLLIADNDESSKAETTAALHHFGNAIDMDEPIHEFRIALFAILALSRFSSHEASH